ncbi:MAG: acetoacetate--CoA ligase [Gemmatimonadaceae bacterium]
MGDTPLWVPARRQVARAEMTRFIDRVRRAELTAGAVHDYPSLYDWSIREPAAFWAAVWRFTGIVADERPDREPWDEVVHGLGRMAPPDPALGPRWFTGSRLNFAENLLRYRDDRVALVGWNEHGAQRRLTYAELAGEVARVAARLRALGVGVGERVAGFLPNIPETVVAMLATASLGAVWSSCSPDFGVNGVYDRFGQIQPKVLFAADGYWYNGKRCDSLERVREIAARIPSIERIVVVGYLEQEPSLNGIRDAERWQGPDPAHAGALSPAPSVQRPASPSSLPFARLPFDHPLYIMYSSGTTGLPKCMVHSAGGTLIQHLKELVLHTDLTRDDTIFYFTTCGWMMWNWLVSSLAVGSTVVLYDGSPLPDARPAILWDMAQAEGVTVFGTSAKWIALSEKAGLRPGQTHDLTALKSILSTGSPLAAHGFDYVYRDVKADVRLSSISGGTDIISCFALGNPIGPVWRGELQARGLGMRVEVFDEHGRPLSGRAGELVCTMPFPSMPVAFWNDPEGSAYRAAYFSAWPDTWRHGDWAEITRHGGMMIYGRSDATLNPGGVRIGTAEIYRQVEQLPEIVESVAVGQEAEGGADVRVILFVRLREGLTLDDPLRERIRARIRAHTSPHHVPRVIVQVADIPRTINGKITELAVREVIHGRPVKNTEALANPAALELYRNLPELAS